VTWAFVRPIGLCALVVACGGDSSGDGGDDDTTTSPTVTISVTNTMSDPTTVDTSDGDDASGTETGETDNGTDPDDTSTTATETCPDTHVCLAAPPEDWNGPVVRLQRPALAPRPSCPTDYPNQQVAAGLDVLADPATCTCSCGQASEVDCELSGQLRYYGNAENCSDVVPASFEIFSTDCVFMPDQFGGFTNWTLDPVPVTGGSCEPELAQSMDAPSFATVVTACGGAEIVPGCDPDEICAPRAGDELCIWQDGDSRCPDGWDERFLYYGTIDDQRGCEECTCAEPTGLCDDAYAVLYGGACNVPIAGVIAGDGECHPTGTSITQSATLVVGEPTAFCEPSVSEATGEAVGSMPTTLCCT
jgi:hypothetical protein